MDEDGMGEEWKYHNKEGVKQGCDGGWEDIESFIWECTFHVAIPIELDYIAQYDLV